MYPSYELYCEFLQFLNRYCDFAKIEEAVEKINCRTIATDCLVSFTYDDGFEECYSIIAPALEEFNTNAAFFINGGFINGNAQYKENFISKIVHVQGKKSMSWEEIKDLHNRGHIIGSHTLDHINLNCSDVTNIDFQLRENKLLIEKCTGNTCDFFAYPFGRFEHINIEVLSLIEKYHKYIFSGTDYKNYYSYNGKVFNRRHLECDWPKPHISYFLSIIKRY